MAKAITIEKVYDELKALKKDINFIKERMIDQDSIMTSEESARFDQSMKEYREGRAVPISCFYNSYTQNQ